MERSMRQVLAGSLEQPIQSEAKRACIVADSSVSVPLQVSIEAVSSLSTQSRATVTIGVFPPTAVTSRGLKASWHQFSPRWREVTTLARVDRLELPDGVYECSRSDLYSYVFCTVRDDQDVVYAVSPLFYYGEEPTWPVDERAATHDNASKSYALSTVYSNVEGDVKASSIRDEGSFDVLAQTNQRAMKNEVTPRSFHFWSRCPCTPVFCDAFQHLSEDPQLPSSLSPVVRDYIELMMSRGVWVSHNRRAECFTAICDLMNESGTAFKSGVKSFEGRWTDYPVVADIAFRCDPPCHAAYGIVSIKSERKERDRGKVEVAQCCRLASYDCRWWRHSTEKSLDYDNYSWPILAIIAFPPAKCAPGAVEVYASINGTLAREDPLLNVEYNGEEDVEKVYQVFGKIVKTLAALRKYAMKLGVTIKDFQFEGDDKVNRSVRLTKKINYRVYMSQIEEERVIVKYFLDGAGDEYGDKAHKYAADKGFAPPILGRWKCSQSDASALVMSYVHGSSFLMAVQEKMRKGPRHERLTRRKKASEIYRNLLLVVEKQTQELHSGGFVHGDLRNENVLVDLEADPKPHVYFIDYDSSGFEGLAKYGQMNPGLYYPSPETGTKILPIHDWYFVAGLKSVALEWGWISSHL